MQLQFEPDLDYQQDAIAAVCDLFQGQEVCRTEFAIWQGIASQLPGLEEGDLGIGNRLELDEGALLANLQKVQLRNGLTLASKLESLNFTVEMETGTGKTYVYLRTIFELNQRYGFTKFAIVVPSVAIKEGVNKSLEIMGSHLRSLYSGVPFEHFVYDSSKLGQVRNFATASQLQIMVVTVGAINKRDVNNIYQPSEKTGGEKPIELVQATHPVLIVDEPQSVDGGLKGQGRRALDRMNPLCTLRYSATHVDKHHMVFRLNAVDAYERALVKRIEVAAGVLTDDHNRPYIRLVSIHRQSNVMWARIEVDVATPNGGVRRRKLNVAPGDDLRMRTRRSMYNGYRIGEIHIERGAECMELRLPGGEFWMALDEVYGDVDPRTIHRAMIRKTIYEHLEKEERLRDRGIKVLTLFFVDRVVHYRGYDEDGQPLKGKYARMFEEEYRRAIKQPKYRDRFDEKNVDNAAEIVHQGYFSVDRKGGWVDTADNNQTNRDNAERAYRLIMRDKERQLSFDEPLQFIFSHSALREGWDNPNIFQICALRDIPSERQRRQTIGRGLRLCVNQSGVRQRGFDVNTLTIIARESYEDFARNLQREIEQDTGIQFGVVEQHAFAFITVASKDGQDLHLGIERSRKIWEHLVSKGYLDNSGLGLNLLQHALERDDLELPIEFEPFRNEVVHALRRFTTRIEVFSTDHRRSINAREAVLESEEFQCLWDRIKHKTTFRVQFDNDAMVDECTKALRDAPPIPRTRLLWHRAEIKVAPSGIEGQMRDASATYLVDDNVDLPDPISMLQDRTGLTRRSVVRILTESGRLDEFVYNPSKFIEIAGEAINRHKRLMLVDGVKYQRLGREHYFAQELFLSEELIGYFRNTIKVSKSVYDYVVCDSRTEASFADALEKLSSVKVYTKLPRWFSVPTPLGSYNPDWAVFVEHDSGERLYFVVETKGSSFLNDLRSTERGKVKCGEAHFHALQTSSSSAEYRVVRTADELIS